MDSERRQRRTRDVEESALIVRMSAILVVIAALLGVGFFGVILYAIVAFTNKYT